MMCIEQEAFISFLRRLEDEALEELCGRKYARIERAYKRAKTVSRVLLTQFGRIVFKLIYIKDAAGEFFSPLLRRLGVQKYQRLNEDLKDRIRNKASKMTYADTAEDVFNSFGFHVSRQEVWRLNQQKQLAITADSTNHKILLSDGTKIKSNQCGHHEVRAIMSVDLEKKEKCLLAFDINKKWEELVQNLDLCQFCVVVVDGENGLRKSFTDRGLEFHYCSLHAIRDLSFYLWNDKLLKTERSKFLKPFAAILYTVQNSTKKYWVDHNKLRLLLRIWWGLWKINGLAAALRKKGLAQSARFLEDNRDYFFTAAKLASKSDLMVPWTTNQIERLMKEIGKRTKKRSMRWSQNGLRPILAPVLKRYFLKPEERDYKNIYEGDIAGGSSPNVNHI